MSKTRINLNLEESAHQLLSAMSSDRRRGKFVSDLIIRESARQDTTTLIHRLIDRINQLEQRMEDQRTG